MRVFPKKGRTVDSCAPAGCWAVGQVCGFTRSLHLLNHTGGLPLGRSGPQQPELQNGMNMLEMKKEKPVISMLPFFLTFFFPNRELFYGKFSMPDSPKFLHSCRQEVGRAASDLCGGTFALSVPRSQNVFPTQRLC